MAPVSAKVSCRSTLHATGATAKLSDYCWMRVRISMLTIRDGALLYMEPPEEEEADMLQS